MGLDLLLPAPPKSGFSTAPRKGPFQSAVYFAAGAVLGCVGSLFAIGDLTCDCTRRETGEVDCVRVSTVWLGTQRLAHNEYRDVREVIETVHGDAWVNLGDGDHAGIVGIPPQPIAEFLTSQEPQLHLVNRSLKMFPWILATAGTVCSVLAVVTAAWAIRLLRQELSNPHRSSATGL
jgi:hypothetical protein